MWYVLQTAPGTEEELLGAIAEKVDRRLWNHIRILERETFWRRQGICKVRVEKMFQGYVFVDTDRPEQLKNKLMMVHGFQKFYDDEKEVIFPVEERDLLFLRNACGEKLEHPMRISDVFFDEEKRLEKIEGIVKIYWNRIVKTKYSRQYVVASVPLWGREEEMVFRVRVHQGKRQ